MLMTNENIRFFPQDHFVKKILLPIIPEEVHPNHLTVLRFLLIPFILFFLWREDWVVSLILFLFAALTDALDGSLARLRKQITEWGTVADPAADKLLIGSVVLLFVAREVNVWFAAVIVFIDALIILGAFIRLKRGGKLHSANDYGKIKMFFQVAGVTMLLVARLFGITLSVPFAVGPFAIAIVFAVVSLLTYGI